MSAASPEAPVYYQRPALTETELETFERIYGTPGDPSDSDYLSHQFAQLGLLGRDIVVAHNFSNKQAITLFREASWEMLAERGDKRKNAYEVSIYAGCQHGEIIKDFDWVLAHPPDFLYVSDLAGSDFETESKGIFYNRLIHHVRNYIGQDNLRTLDASGIRKMVSSKGEEILAIMTDEKSGSTILDGYKNLYAFVRRFAEDEESMPDPDDRSGVIDWIARFTPKDQNHGYWMGSLAKSTREKILEEIASKTRDVTEKLQLIRGKGARVIVVPGNWDTPESLDIIARGDGNPENQVIDYFSTIKYLRQQNFEVYEELSVLETETAFTVMAPFFWLLQSFNHERNNPKYQMIKGLAEQARKDGKLLMLYPHAALHHADTSSSNQIVAINALQLMSDFNVDEVAYGHDHFPASDHQFHEYPVYEYVSGGSAARITDAIMLDQLGIEPMGVADYVPKGHIAVAIRRRKLPLQMSNNVLPAKIL